MTLEEMEKRLRATEDALKTLEKRVRVTEDVQFRRLSSCKGVMLMP